MDFQEIRYQVAEHVATITLDRPERLNAYTRTMHLELIQAFDLVDADDDVRAVIVTGAGRGFCAGADLEAGGETFDWTKRQDAVGAQPAEPAASAKGVGAQPAEPAASAKAVGAQPAGPAASAGPGEMAEASGTDVPRDGGGTLTLRIFRCTKPVIAAINGPAVGVGITMTLAMDVRLAAAGAKIGFVFARRGIVPEACSSWFLPRIVGISQAMEWVATGRVFSAEEALAGRLVRSVHEPEEVLPAARALAAEIAENAAPASVALARRLMWTMLGAGHPMEAHRAESRAMFARGQSEDAREGIAAFLEKRAAEFPDRVSAGLPDILPDWEEPEYR